VLAPVLARLDRIVGVAHARVEASGTWFLVDTWPAAARHQVEEEVLGVLGPTAEVLSPDAAGLQVGARDRGDHWYSSRDILGLSYLEARIIAGRVSASVGREAQLPQHAVRALCEGVRAEVFAAVERVHAEGGRSSGSWFFKAWPALAERILSRVAAALPPGSGGPAGESLRRQFSP
jgi:hypothetical protein